MSLLRGFPIIADIDADQKWLPLALVDVQALTPGHFLLATIVDTGPSSVTISDVEYVELGYPTPRQGGPEGVFGRGYHRFVRRGVGGPAIPHAAGAELLRYEPDAPRVVAARYPANTIDVTWT
jgi:hypothetical protein